MLCVCVFFFQAEDGIRDLVRSRGLGDVYKRQEVERLYKAKQEEIGEDNYNQLQRYVALRAVDQLWMEHLDTMDHLRDSVRLRGYGCLLYTSDAADERFRGDLGGRRII